MTTVQQARDEALVQLAQVAFVAVAHHQVHEHISDQAEKVFRNPDLEIEIGTNEPATQKAERKRRIVRILEQVKKDICDRNLTDGDFTSKTLRHLINRMLVTHVVSILEKMLDFFGEHQGLTERDLPRSFAGKCRKIKWRSAVSDIPGYKECELLAQVRHVIVHNAGTVDKKFKDYVQSQSIPLASPLKKLRVGKDAVSIPIDEYILPSLHQAVAFVIAAEQALIQDIGTILTELAREVPKEEWDRLPHDLTDNLDHYIYGTPKDTPEE